MTMTMKFEGLTLGRGVLRVYMVLWLCWVLVLSFFSHKELLTSVGVTYWSEQSAIERQIVELEPLYELFDCNTNWEKNKKECADLYIEMHSVPIGSVVTKDDAKNALETFMYNAVAIPIAVLFAGFVIWFLAKWVINGFVGVGKK
jgi:hypothetical protein